MNNESLFQCEDLYFFENPNKYIIDVVSEKKKVYGQDVFEKEEVDSEFFSLMDSLYQNL